MAEAGISKVVVYNGVTDDALRIAYANESAYRIQALPITNGPHIFSVWIRSAENQRLILSVLGKLFSQDVTTSWVRYTFAVESPSTSYIDIMPSTFRAIYLYQGKLEEGTKPTDWTPAPEDIDERVSRAEVKLTDDAIVATVTQSARYKSDLDAVQQVADNANATAANVRAWMRFDTDGLKQGKDGSTYSTLVDAYGFHILQNDEKISSFARRQLASEEVRIGKLSSNDSRCVLREAGDGGMIITVEALG